MVRSFTLVLVAAAALTGRPLAAAEDEAPPPSRFELMINGESFLVEAGRQMKLESRAKPGVSYQVAIRVAPQQPLRLATIQLLYDQGCTVADLRDKTRRAARIQHPLGFTMSVADFGEPMDAKTIEKSLGSLAEEAAKAFRESGMKEVTVTEPHQHKFKGAESRSVKIHCQDGEGVAQTCVVAVLSGRKFAASCVVHYCDKDSDDVLRRIASTLDSIQEIGSGD